MVKEVKTLRSRKMQDFEAECTTYSYRGTHESSTSNRVENLNADIMKDGIRIGSLSLNVHIDDGIISNKSIVVDELIQLISVLNGDKEVTA